MKNKPLLAGLALAAGCYVLTHETQIESVPSLPKENDLLDSQEILTFYDIAADWSKATAQETNAVSKFFACLDTLVLPELTPYEKNAQIKAAFGLLMNTNAYSKMQSWEKLMAMEFVANHNDELLYRTPANKKLFSIAGRMVEDYAVISTARLKLKDPVAKHYTEAAENIAALLDDNKPAQKNTAKQMLRGPGV